MTDRNLNTLIDNLAAAKAAQDAAKKAYDTLKAQVLTELETRGVNTANSGSHVVTRSEISSNRLDTKRIKLEFPEVYEEFNTVSISIRLTVK